MTVESWVKEFYPITAENCPEEDQVTHSLRKWRGMTPENLERHELKVDGHSNLISKSSESPDYSNTVFAISGSTCALCAWDIHKSIQLRVMKTCSFCPLFIHTGGTCHDRFYTWCYDRNPEPMLQLLTEVLNTQLKIK